MIDLENASWPEVLEHVMRPSPTNDTLEELAHRYGRLQAMCEQLIIIRNDLQDQLENYTNDE